MAEPVNRRETGARTLRRKTQPDGTDQVSQEAAKNRQPPGQFGNAEPANDQDEKTRHSDGRQPPARR